MNAFAILSKPRAPTVPTKAVKRYRQMPMTQAVQRATAFTAPIATQAECDRTNAIKGRAL